MREYYGQLQELVARFEDVDERAWYRMWIEGLCETFREAVSFEGAQTLSDAISIAKGKERASRCSNSKAWDIQVCTNGMLL